MGYGHGEGQWVDPLIRAGIGLFIVPRTCRPLNEAPYILLEGTPPRVDLVGLKVEIDAMTGHVVVEDVAAGPTTVRSLLRGTTASSMLYRSRTRRSPPRLRTCRSDGHARKKKLSRQTPSYSSQPRGRRSVRPHVRRAADRSLVKVAAAVVFVLALLVLLARLS